MTIEDNRHQKGWKKVKKEDNFGRNCHADKVKPDAFRHKKIYLENKLRKQTMLQWGKSNYL